MSNSVYISQKNLSYAGLKNLVEKLEGLCLKSLLKSHLIISTCKMQGVSVLDYFKRFFSEIVKGHKGYEHLLPLTIGVN